MITMHSFEEWVLFGILFMLILSVVLIAHLLWIFISKWIIEKKRKKALKEKQELIKQMQKLRRRKSELIYCIEITEILKGIKYE